MELPDNENNVDYDLIVISGTAGGLSVAMSMLEAGLTRVRVIVPPGEAIAFPDLIAENQIEVGYNEQVTGCLLYTSPSPRDLSTSRMPSSA